MDVKGEKVESINQLRAVASRLRYKRKSGKGGQTDNCLTCALFDPRIDLYPILQNQKPHMMGNSPIPPCLTLLDFKVESQKLHLFAIFRSQYFDTKAYGNWISLGVLLKKMCEATGFQPGKVVSLACNATFDNKKDARKFLEKLSKI